MIGLKLVSVRPSKPVLNEISGFVHEPKVPTESARATKAAGVGTGTAGTSRLNQCERPSTIEGPDRRERTAVRRMGDSIVVAGYGMMMFLRSEKLSIWA